MIRTGWNADSFAIVTNEAIKNPAICPPPDGYITDSAQPGYKTYYAAALLAFEGRIPIPLLAPTYGCKLVPCPGIELPGRDIRIMGQWRLDRSTLRRYWRNKF
jgi:hypothetical protein